MMAVYPGGGARYVRHFDSLAGASKMQKRFCTLILYLNPFWESDHGGHLRLYPGLPGKEEKHVDVEPLHGRLLAFLCAGRNAHEVMPAWRKRFAITWWVRSTHIDVSGWGGLGEAE